MARIRWQDIMDDDDVELPTYEPIRRNSEPVNGHHDMLRRTENKMNRERARLDKMRDRD